MSAPDLTVVIPCHNVADTLAEQLEALATQEWDGSWDVIVVNNGSTDATVEVARRSPLDARMRILDAFDGQSVAYARNAGASATDARSIAFCDGDDIVRPGWIAAMGDALDEHPLVTGAVDATVINEPWLAASRPNSASSSLPRFGETPFARGNNTGMHRSVWELVGGYDEDFRGLEDIEFSLRAAAAGVTPVYVSAAIVDYRYRAGVGPLWRQGWFYGRGRAELRSRARALELPVPTRVAGLKSWIWLVVQAPQLRSRSGRYAWTWVLANRLGALAGALTQLSSRRRR